MWLAKSLCTVSPFIFVLLFHPAFLQIVSNASAPWRPKVGIIGDNLAVNVTWPSRNSQQRQISHYRVQFRHRGPHERRWVRPFVVAQTRLSGTVSQPYMFVTNEQPGGLEAGKVYQFQVVAVSVNAHTPEEKSGWSAATFFDYIYPEPPLVRVARRLTDGSVHIKWSRPWRQRGFKITRFVILFRKEKRLPGGETGFRGFHYITAPGNLEEHKVLGLDQKAGYQFVVYGENIPEGVDPSKSLFTGGLNGRKITAFSQEVFVPMDEHVAGAKGRDGSIDVSSSNGQISLLDMNTNASNSLMFLILGVLSGAMLIIMAFLVAICLLRQRKEKLRLLGRIAVGDSKQTDTRPIGGAPGASKAMVMSNGNVGNESMGPKVAKVSGGAGFLLAELTPIAVANFRTAPRPPIAAVGACDPPLPSLQLAPSPPAFEPHPSDSSTIEFHTGVIDMKREPPSGGSIHEESDDNHEENAKEVAASVPPSMHESAFFKQIPYNVHGYPFRDFHFHRRPPSAELGSNPWLQRYNRGQGYALGNGYRKGLDGWGMTEEARGSRLSRLGSRSFAHHHPAATPAATTATMAKWPSCQHPYSASTHLSLIAPPDLSPRPQRIQAIVPQTGQDEVNTETTELADLEFSLNLNSFLEASALGRQAKSPSAAVSSERPRGRRLQLLHQRGSFDLHGKASLLTASPGTIKAPDQPEQANAYTQTVLSDNDGRVLDVEATPSGKKRRLIAYHPRLMHVTSNSSSSFPVANSESEDLCRPA